LSSKLRLPDKLSLPDRISYLIATGFGAGLAPLAPGTLGALEGILVFLVIVWGYGRFNLAAGWAEAIFAAINIVAFVSGVAASNRVCRLLGQKDPGRVIVDEISGQLISLTPILLNPSWLAVVTGFVLFRVFDIFKPYPIRKLEMLPEGLGVMADDVLAGIYAAVLLWAARRFHLM